MLNCMLHFIKLYHLNWPQYCLDLVIPTFFNFRINIILKEIQSVSLVGLIVWNWRIQLTGWWRFFDALRCFCLNVSNFSSSSLRAFSSISLRCSLLLCSFSISCFLNSSLRSLSCLSISSWCCKNGKNEDRFSWCLEGGYRTMQKLEPKHNIHGCQTFTAWCILNYYLFTFYLFIILNYCKLWSWKQRLDECLDLMFFGFVRFFP